MRFKEKLIGIIVILFGAWPFLLKIEQVGTFFASYKFLEMLTPGEVVYQIALIVLGILLIWSVNVKADIQARR